MRDAGFHHCSHPGLPLAHRIRNTPPSEVTFRLSPSYGLTTGHEANEWFIEMMHDYEEFEVETDKAGESPLPFCSVTVRRVAVDRLPLRNLHPCTTSSYV